MSARNGRPVRLRLLRTLYPHWGRHTSTDAFLRYLPAGRYEADARLVNDGDADFPYASLAIRGPLRHLVRRKGMGWYKLSDLVAEFDAAKAAAAGRLDLLHYLDGEHSAQYLPRVGRMLSGGRTRLIATYHQPLAMLPGLVRRDVVRRLDAAILVSDSQRPFFEGLLPPDRLVVIPHGIDTDIFRPSPEAPSDGVFRCISVGHWLRDYTAVAAVAERMREDPGIRFDIVSPYETGLEQLPNVTHHKGISDADLVALYQRADLLLLPLKDATANNAILEGLACGLPVLSTRLESVRLYVPGDEAILLQRNDPEALCEAINRLRRDPADRARRGALARARAETLAWPQLAARFDQLYTAVLG